MHTQAYGQGGMNAYHNYLALYFNDGSTVESNEVPVVALDPWPRARPDVFDGKTQRHYWAESGDNWWHPTLF
jgi:hypothetical protein